MNADGSDPRRLTHNPANDGIPSWSPGGAQVAFQSNRDGNWEIYVINADGSELQRVTHSNADDEFPDWSPDGSQIVFHSNRDGNWELYIATLNSDAPLQRLTNNTTGEWQPAWSPDGTRIAFASERDGNSDIYIMGVDGTNQQRLTYDSAWDLAPAWSLDGDLIAFQSYRNGNWDVFVMNVTEVLRSETRDDSLLRQITESVTPDEFPSWSPDGSELVYESQRGDEEIYIMNIDGSQQRSLTANRFEDYGPDWRTMSDDSEI